MGRCSSRLLVPADGEVHSEALECRVDWRAGPSGVPSAFCPKAKFEIR